MYMFLINPVRLFYESDKGSKEQKQKLEKKLSKTDEYNMYFNKKSPKYYNRPKSKSRGSGTVDIAWELPSEMEEDVYGRYLDLLKSGDLAPNTSFKNFEENYSNYDAKLIQKKKALQWLIQISHYPLILQLL